MGEHEEHEQDAELDGGHRRLGQSDAELQELAVNPGGTPQRIGQRHPANQIADLEEDGWSTTLVSALPGPVKLEALPVPADHGRGLDDDEAFSPSIPGPSEPEPKGAA